MSCLPESGKCERPFTDAFVEYLNSTESRQYIHRACLDVLNRSSAQPEALYGDAERHLELVIERKSISWPVDYPYRHQNDHMVGDTFSQALGNLLSDDLYELRLPPLIAGKRSDLRSFALAAAATVRDRWPLPPEKAFKQRVNKGLWWYFRRVPMDEREEGEPSYGLKVVWESPGIFSREYLDPANA